MCKYPSKEYFIEEYINKGKTREQLAQENGVSVATIKTHLYKKRIVKPSIIPTEEVIRLYVEEKKTIKEIAKITNHDRNAIARTLTAHHIGKENHYSQYDDTLDDEWIALYLDEGLSTFEIAKQYGTIHSTVRKHLLHCGIDVRNMSEALRMTWSKPFLSSDLSDYDIMYRSYVTEKKTLKELGEQYDCAPHVVRRCLVDLGIPIRSQSEAKIGLMTGDKHPNWKGGVTTLTQRLREFYNVNLAPLCRKRDLCQCAMCGTKRNLHTHHIVPFSWIVHYQIQQHPELDILENEEEFYDIITHDPEFLDVGNLITVCRDCHLYKIHGYKKTTSSQASK